MLRRRSPRLDAGGYFWLRFAQTMIALGTDRRFRLGTEMIRFDSFQFPRAEVIIEIDRLYSRSASSIRDHASYRSGLGGFSHLFTGAASAWRSRWRFAHAFFASASAMGRFILHACHVARPLLGSLFCLRLYGGQCSHTSLSCVGARQHSAAGPCRRQRSRVPRDGRVGSRHH